jgi:hypothetical protein
MSTGCASPTVGTMLLPTAASKSVDADWNDIDASVDVAASKAEMAVVAKDSASAHERTFELRTIRDQPAWLVITRAAKPGSAAGEGGGEGVEFSMRCTVGYFGDKPEEERLLRALKQRLEELRGVETRPLD